MREKAGYFFIRYQKERKVDRSIITCEAIQMLYEKEWIDCSIADFIG